MTCQAAGCDRAEDRDGLCFRHRMASVSFGGLVTLRNERHNDYTQREVQREIFDAARADGRDIQKASW